MMGGGGGGGVVVVAVGSRQKCPNKKTKKQQGSYECPVSIY